VPKIIAGGKSATREDRQTTRASRYEIIDINRLSQAFFRIQSVEVRERIISLIEEIAENERREISEIY
jgi:hypothetical protein